MLYRFKREKNGGKYVEKWVDTLITAKIRIALNCVLIALYCVLVIGKVNKMLCLTVPA